MFLAACSMIVAGAEDADGSLRKEAVKRFDDGNFKDALELYRKLLLNPATDPLLVGEDLQSAVTCLQKLNRVNETDELLEQTVTERQDNWRLLMSAAQSFFNAGHYGSIVAGVFQRGRHAGGKWAVSYERDRVRAMQIMEQARPAAREDPERKAVARFYNQYAGFVMGRRGQAEAWRLQALTDLSKLPDFEEQWRYHHSGGSSSAPVDASGNPVFHHLPESFDKATSDGERWRWLSANAARLDESLRTKMRWDFAEFLYSQFSVNTLADYRWFFQDRGDDATASEATRTYSLHTLSDKETIARLATGIRRFSLPDEFNCLSLYKQIAAAEKGRYAERALDRLAYIFENRRQYAKAARYWRRSIERHGEGKQQRKHKRIEQIVGKWGRFESTRTHPAGEKATVGFRFRNGNRLNLKARRLDVPELLRDVKAYLKSNPRHLEHDKLNIGDIGYRLVHQDETKYVMEEVSSWSVELSPRGRHFDKLIDIRTPLSEPGAYLLTGEMENGNVSKIVIWIDDTVIVRKRLRNRDFFFVGDAATGKPVARANVEFFGYRRDRKREGVAGERRFDISTARFAEFTSQDGELFPNPKDFSSDYQWLIVATTPPLAHEEDSSETVPGGRFAYLGFSRVWHRAGTYDTDYKATKVIAITDRPVYRPDQNVKFKLWVRHVRYDQEQTSFFADREFKVEVLDPHGDKVFDRTLKTDAYGGIVGEYPLPEDAPLGVYSLRIPEYPGGSFRVEEYKKPEFEVSVEPPDKPVMLGERISATVKASYYFGAPVTDARVKIRILRTSQSANWYPVAPWDWFYGRGYWWFAYDYNWYPGWEEWGCPRPACWWRPVGRTPPEVVAETEQAIDKDGTVKISIDTAIAGAMHGDKDHRYEITAEVTDESRRTIVGGGAILVARKPFKVYAWLDRGYYRVGDTAEASFSAHTIDNTPVEGSGKLTLYRIAYAAGEPIETPVEEWNLATDAEGRARLRIKAAGAGQYRLSFKVTDSAGHTIEGACLFVVRGDTPNSGEYEFNDIELIPDKKEYAPGETVRLLINTKQADSTVVLFIRPANGIYLNPDIIRLDGKSEVVDITVGKRDMPNFFVEAFTVHKGKVHSETREIVVPPEKRVLNAEVLPSAHKYKPGERASVRVKLTDFLGAPIAGSIAMSVYDRSVEYISGGSNVPEIRSFFWKWRRRHYPRTESSIARIFSNIVLPKAIAMSNLGIFGHLVADESDSSVRRQSGGEGVICKSVRLERKGVGGMLMANGMSPPMAAAPEEIAEEQEESLAKPSPSLADATVRRAFADTAYWNGAIETDTNGIAEVAFVMPENITGWKIRAWAVAHGTVVGEGAAEVVTAKMLLLRMQAPRFFVENDRVVLSANIHNYLPNDKAVRAILEIDGDAIRVVGSSTQKATVRAGGETRVDWRIKVQDEGEVAIRMKALTDVESDAMEMVFPAYVHGMLKTDSFCGVVRSDASSISMHVKVPRKRRVEQTRLEIRYSPTLAGAIVDALPYMVDYPYGCTEQTLNRFVPTIVTRKVLKDLGLDMKAIAGKRTNLNAQEIGDDRKRSLQWKRWNRNPVFDDETVADMAKQGLKRLTAMQLFDGGWGWFSGRGECSQPHTTAVVVHGLQTARENGLALAPGLLEGGIGWLRRYQAAEVRKLGNAETRNTPWKTQADNLDAFVYMVLVDSGHRNEEMREFLYRDRVDLSLYAKAMFGLALHKEGHTEDLEMILSNISQHLVTDDENQTAYLNLPERRWWRWYGCTYEAHAYYLKLLARVGTQNKTASGIVKYLLNNRKHATYWNSTRDTALCIEAIAEYLTTSGEHKPDMTIEILLDGKTKKHVRIKPEDLFLFDNRFIIEGRSLKAGEHTVEVRRKGAGTLYFNVYLTNFTKEDHIKNAGLEIKVRRDYYKLRRIDRTANVSGSHGQVVDQKVEKYERVKLAELSTLKSGDLVEIELTIDSKNDYEYVVFEDMKAAGFEPVDARSGYTGDSLGAYMELRDEKVVFFVRQLPRGRHSVSYRMRAEIPGRFSALPTRAHAMYAPELRANSDEIKLKISD